MFLWAPIPESYAHLSSIEFCKLAVNEANVVLSPGVGFGPGRRVRPGWVGEGVVRFALVENEQRIRQAVNQLRYGLPKLGG